MGDLPDWYTQIQSATLRATSIQGGLDADKSASPVAEDVYLARDTGILYVCFVSGAWTNIGILYLLLAGGTMSGAIAMGTNKITGVGAPVASTDAARKSEVDTVSALLDNASVAQPARVIDTIYQNTGGKIRVVTVSLVISLGVTETAQAVIGSSSPPTTDAASVGHSSGATGADYGSMTFIVPPSWYYRVNSATGTPTIDNWIEYDLL